MPRCDPFYAGGALVGLAACCLWVVLVVDDVVEGGGFWAVPIVVVALVSLVALLGAVPMPCIKPSYSTQPGSLLTRAEEEAAAASQLPLDRFRIVGSHNSCHVASMFSAFIPYWRYTHAPLLTLLGMGLRHLELDLWFSRRTGCWEIRHEALIDPLVTVEDTAFVSVLRMLLGWSRQNTGHFPLILNLDIKGAYRTGRSWFAPVCGRDLSDRHCDKVALERLRGEIESVWPAHGLILPSDVIGQSATLREAVGAHGWPPVCTLRGRCMFLLNIYGDRCGLRRVADHAWWWVRDSGDDDPNCVYAEKGLGTRGVLRRGAVFTGGEKLTEMGHTAATADAELEKMQRLNRENVQLLVADSLERVHRPSVLLMKPPAPSRPASGGDETSPLFDSA
eukprot:TRINITY_DN7977_c0_g1_i1.p1 TRINITY_DN7977_c0_g1~~TRINITY_DN7977_c0_g1_i1.p1  ORF type:complete len:410 (+),score=115.81 TRINITY_DN7977_c0_g1_i1:57-1232(+)